MLQLELCKESIDVGKVRLFFGLYAIVKAIDATSKYALSKGVIGILSNTEVGPVCRKVIVYLDLYQYSQTQTQPLQIMHMLPNLEPKQTS